MPRKSETPKIKMVTVTYNGDREQFDKFMEAVICGYLNSGEVGSMPKIAHQTSVKKVEIFDETA